MKMTMNITLTEQEKTDLKAIIYEAQEIVREKNRLRKLAWPIGENVGWICSINQWEYRDKKVNK